MRSCFSTRDIFYRSARRGCAFRVPLLINFSSDFTISWEIRALIAVAAQLAAMYVGTASHTAKGTAASHIWVHSIFRRARLGIRIRSTGAPWRACSGRYTPDNGGTLMDGVRVPSGTMERTSPSHHPSLSESFIAATVYIYERPYTYICLRSSKRSPRRTCMLHIYRPQLAVQPIRI